VLDPCVDVDTELEPDVSVPVPPFVPEDALDPCVEVEPEAAVLVFVFDVEFDALPLDFDPELFIAKTACHQLAVAVVGLPVP